MHEWRATVHCPVRPVHDAPSGLTDPTGFIERQVHVWTSQHSAVDAYDEALQVLARWPIGSKLVDIEPMGMYRPCWDGDGCPRRRPEPALAPSTEAQPGS